MANPRRIQREILHTLDILRQNFRMQSPDKNPKQKEITVEVYLIDFRQPDSLDGIDPKTFHRTVLSFKKEGIKINQHDHDWLLTQAYEYGAEHTVSCEVTLPANFEEVYKILVKEVNEDSAGTLRHRTQRLTQQKLLHKDERGNYFYNNKRIILGEDTLYYKVLDTLYSYSNQEGFLSYEDIEIHLVKAGYEEIKDKRKRNKRIINAIGSWQGLFRFAKIGKRALENKTSNGDKLIEGVRGSGLKLNN